MIRGYTNNINKTICLYHNCLQDFFHNTRADNIDYQLSSLFLIDIVTRYRLTGLITR